LIYHEENETEKHILWDCEYAKEVWQGSLLSALCQRPRLGSLSDLVELVLSELPAPDTELFFTIAWNIWGNRNAGWLNQPQVEASILGSQALSYVEEYMEANKKQTSSFSTSIKTWTPPLEPSYKTNVAWKFFKSRCSYGVGSLIRDHNGALLAAYAEELPISGDRLHMATLSLSRALNFLRVAGFQQIIAKFTHSQLHALLKSSGGCLIELSELLYYIKSFHSIFFSFELQCLSLADSTKENTGPSIWYGERPAFILPIV
jgi:hypothetical protein